MENVDLDYSMGIKLQNVSFQYPNTDRKALDGINLEIKPGETIAIVGENGAGKTTLAICYFYEIACEYLLFL